MRRSNQFDFRTRPRSGARFLSSFLLKLGLILPLSLGGCSLPKPQANQAAQQSIAAATQAALDLQTEIARPSPTPTLSPTSTPLPPSATPPQSASQTPGPGATQAASGTQVTPLPGMNLYTFPDVPEYAFQADPTLWKFDPSGPTSSLSHKTISNCKVQSVLGRGIGPPQRYFYQDLGRFRWEILDYGSTALVNPILGNGIDGSGSYLILQGYNQAVCRTALETILANMLTSREAAGQIPFALFASPTPRPPIEGFSCPNTPPSRLRVGDWVSVITDGLWLRSEPRADQSTQVSKFLRYAPFMIRIIAGPVCEKYVYWQVEVSTFGEAGTTTSGWLAEGDPQEYYIVPVK